MYIYIVTVNIVILYLATRYSDIHNICLRIYMYIYHKVSLVSQVSQILQASQVSQR